MAYEGVDNGEWSECSSSPSSSHESLDDSPLFTPPASPTAFGDGVRGGAQAIVTVARSFISPPIPGLLYLSDFLDDDEAQRLVHDVTQCNYFDIERGRDQAVLFGARDAGHAGGLPNWATSLLSVVEERLRGSAHIDDAIEAVFSPSPSTPCLFTRQLILNVYRPGQGIAAHVDLPHRFLDGIMILSFGHGIAMDFVRQGGDALDANDARSIYLQPRSLCILTGESRWHWAHGIAARTFDLVDDPSTATPLRIERGPRLSITIRWLKIEPDDGESLLHHGSPQPDLRM